MKVGDIVEIHIPVKIPGALTAAKFFGRLKSKTKDLPGIIVEDHGSSASVLFGETIHVISKRHIKVVNDEQSKNR